MDKKTLDKINSMTRRSFRAEELYTFPVTLCGNEVDRDGERFSNEALEALQTLFIGKTFIADHHPTMENQIARVYDTELVTTDTLTSYGEPYKYLKHRASTQGESLSRLTGENLKRSMRNGSRRTLRAGTSCEEWTCRLTRSTAVCMNMKPETALSSRLPLDNAPLVNGNAPRAVRACRA